MTTWAQRTLLDPNRSTALGTVDQKTGEHVFVRDGLRDLSSAIACSITH